jgi:hypothetical protein
MRLADIASAEFAAEREKRSSLVVEAWRNTTVFWSAWTGEDYDAVFGPGAPTALNARMVRIIVTKAQDERGKPLFVPPEEEQLLKEAKPEVLALVGGAILAALPTPADQATIAKN